MALIVRGTVYTGSTAAGPALEGQQIEDGLLALPGAISDVEFEPDGDRQDTFSKGSAPNAKPLSGKLKTRVLSMEMTALAGDTVDPATGRGSQRVNWRLSASPAPGWWV